MVTQFLEVNQKKELICVTLIILQEYLSGWLQVDIYDKFIENVLVNTKI